MMTLKSSSMLLVSLLLVTPIGAAHAQMIVANVCPTSDAGSIVCTATCPAGHEAIGGGGAHAFDTLPDFTFSLEIGGSPAGISGFVPGGSPSGGADGWNVAQLFLSANGSIGVWAVCVAQPGGSCAGLTGLERAACNHDRKLQCLLE